MKILKILVVACVLSLVAFSYIVGGDGNKDSSDSLPPTATPVQYYETPIAGGEPFQIRELPRPEVTPTFLPQDMELNPLMLQHPVLMIPDDGRVPFVYPDGYPIVHGMPTMKLPSPDPQRREMLKNVTTWTEGD